MRIVSLLPSATEIVCALGLRDQLVGVTHECDYPPGVAALPHVTASRIPHDASSGDIDRLVRGQLEHEAALYSLKQDVLRDLAPDLIVTQALCDVCAVADAEVRAAACTLPNAPGVVNLEPTCLEEMFDCVRAVGAAAGRSEAAAALVARMRERVATVERAVGAATTRPSVVLLEWIDPPFCSGHWSPELIALAGGREVLGRGGERSHTLDWNDVRAADPDVLFIACCGFDLVRTARDLPLLTAYDGFDELAAVRNGQVWLTDGNAYFSRPGPRLIDSLEIMAATLHPGLFTLAHDLPAAQRVQADGRAETSAAAR